jgi:TPR repeat protein
MMLNGKEFTRRRGTRMMIRARRLCGGVILLCAVSIAQSTHAEYERSSPGKVAVAVARIPSKDPRPIAALGKETSRSSSTNDLYGAMNHLAIRYARGLGVSKDAKMAFRLFMSLAMDGYTPAMVNIGILYESGLAGHRNRQLAYAWVRAALIVGVPDANVDAAVYRLGFLAARLGSRKTAKAERAARRIALAIAEQTARSDIRNYDSAQCERVPRVDATADLQSTFSPGLPGPPWDGPPQPRVSADSMMSAGSDNYENRFSTSK